MLPPPCSSTGGDQPLAADQFDLQGGHDRRGLPTAVVVTQKVQYPVRQVALQLAPDAPFAGARRGGIEGEDHVSQKPERGLRHRGFSARKAEHVGRPVPSSPMSVQILNLLVGRQANGELTPAQSKTCKRPLGKPRQAGRKAASAGMVYSDRHLIAGRHRSRSGRRCA